MLLSGTEVLILASESPRRKELLARTGVKFICVPAGVEEYSESGSPECLPEQNALLKASFAAGKYPEHFVIGADTGVFSGGRMFGKPADHCEAVKMLSELAGTTHKVITGTALICRNKGVIHSWSTVSHVTFGELTGADIENYMRCVHVFDKAGAYGIQEYPELLKASWDGELENIIGLPIIKLTELLRQYKLLR